MRSTLRAIWHLIGSVEKGLRQKKHGIVSEDSPYYFAAFMTSGFAVHMTTARLLIT